MNGNDKAPDRIKELLGKQVHVHLGRSGGYKGTLLAYHDRPVIVLQNARYAGTGGGISEGDKVFPADTDITEVQVPPPAKPCPHCGQTPWNPWNIWS